VNKKLVIVESPAKCKTIGKILGTDYLIKATMGHIRDLPQKELGVKIEQDFKPKYVILPDRKKIVNELLKISGQCKVIYVATDPDREGEAIGWHLAHVLKRDSLQRITFNEITKEAVLAAIKKPEEIDLNKVSAQQARRILDRLVGYQISPLLWRYLKSGLSAGRVQSVAVRLICEREEEIKKFIPQEYWEITAQLQTENQKILEAKLLRFKKKKIEIHTQAQAEEIVQQLKTKPFLVQKISFKKKKRTPLPPFITSTLQQEAVNKLNFSAEKTMKVAQQLYEGLSLEGEVVGLITYMRTDSTRLSAESIKEARNYIKKNWGKEYCPEKTPRYETKTLSQDAHEAIRPTSVLREPEKIKATLSSDQFKLYQLIWRRFLASQMAPAQLATTTIDILAGTYLFRASGTVVEFDGFMRLYQVSDEKTEKKEKVLPLVKEGEKLNLKKLTPSQHFTKPPPRFTEASLVKELEEQGIGRPSTYATIINTIQLREYVKKEKGKFYPTELGTLVNKILVKNFPRILDVQFTAHLEEDLDKIERGEEEWKKVLLNFYRPFYQELQKAKLGLQGVKKDLEMPTEETCPLCGKPMKIKWGRHGRFLACSGFPQCKNTQPLLENSSSEKEEKKLTESCPQCGHQLRLKTGPFGQFVACSNYPQCKFTKPLSLNIKCPQESCDGEIVERRSKKGRVFFGCTRYPKCKFMSWDKPVDKPCPSCGFRFLVEKNGKLKCANKNCRYEAQIES
jgi:DNA topoisomerase-1